MTNMILWTMQHKAVVEQLLKDGVYHSDGKYLCDDDFHTAYDWLVEKMKQKMQYCSAKLQIIVLIALILFQTGGIMISKKGGIL